MKLAGLTGLDAAAVAARARNAPAMAGTPADDRLPTMESVQLVAAF